MSLRFHFVCAGSKLELGAEENQVPIVLIHRPGGSGSSSRGLSTDGWDVILPAGWAMPFWIAFVYRYFVHHLQTNRAIAFID